MLSAIVVNKASQEPSGQFSDLAEACRSPGRLIGAGETSSSRCSLSTARNDFGLDIRFRGSIQFRSRCHRRLYDGRTVTLVYVPIRRR